MDFGPKSTKIQKETSRDAPYTAIWGTTIRTGEKESNPKHIPIPRPKETFYGANLLIMSNPKRRVITNSRMDKETGESTADDPES